MGEEEGRGGECLEGKVEGLKSTLEDTKGLSRKRGEGSVSGLLEKIKGVTIGSGTSRGHRTRMARVSRHETGDINRARRKDISAQMSRSMLTGVKRQTHHRVPNVGSESCTPSQEVKALHCERRQCRVE